MSIMNVDGSKWKIKLFIKVVILLSVYNTLLAQSKVIFLTYGPEAGQTYGDYYNHQFIHFRVPSNYDGQAFIRMFDIGFGGSYDTKYGVFDSEYEVTLFKNFIDENSFETNLKSIDISKFPAVKSFTVRDDDQFLNKWISFAVLDKTFGTEINGYRYYSLSVRGVKGNDANSFDVFLSSSQTSNGKINDTRIICYESTFRLQKRAGKFTFRFNTEKNNFNYKVRTFDFDNASLGFSTLLRQYSKINSSGDGTWGTSIISLNKYEAGNDIGLTIGPNNSSTVDNDLVISLYNSDNSKAAYFYPPEEFNAGIIPVVKTEVKYLGNCRSVELNATNSYDPGNGIINVKWHLDNSEPAEGLIIFKDYNDYGKYNAEVLAYNNSNEITRAAVLNIPITINRPPFAVAGEDKISAPGELLYFDASKSYDLDGKIINFIWDFGDGNTANGIRVKHAYQNPGQFTVTLKVEDNFTASPCRFSASTLNVVVNQRPKAKTELELIGSADEIITFSASGSSDPDGIIKEYIWDFGRFGKKFGESVTHTFPEPGMYKVSLIVIDNTTVRNNTDIKEVSVRINHPPVSLPGTDKIIAIGEEITFDGSNSNDKDGIIIGYFWDLGDGNTASGERFTHSYTSSGIYTVTLNVKDNSETSTSSSSATMKVTVNEPPIADAGETQFIVSGYTEFDGSKSNDPDGFISKFIWDFGDNFSGSGERVFHSYKQPGVYDVTLTVIDNTPTKNNSSVSRLKVYVNARPEANAGGNIITAPGEKFNLDASASFDSDGEITKFVWKFGGHTLSEEISFTHQFDKPGIYQIDLTVKDDFIIPTYNHHSIEVLVNNPPVAVITAPISAEVNSPVIFDAGRSFDSEGDITNYRWEFSNGMREVGGQIKHIFKEPGFYEVKLLVEDEQNTSNSISEAVSTIFINSSPIAKTNASVRTCETVVVLDASESVDPDGDPLTYYWNFFDGTFPSTGIKIKHDFEKYGIYPVMLIVDDNNSLKNSRDSISFTVAINAPPKAIIGNDTTICAGDLLILNGLSSYDPEGAPLMYEWYFDDGTYLTGESISKFWIESGIKHVTLKVTDNSGLPCNSSFDSKLIYVLASPIADAGEDIVACINTPVYFDGSRSTDIDGIVDSYEWDFGDGEFGGGVKPVHIYKEAGVYEVNLTITGSPNAQCDNKAYDKITVVVNQGPAAHFSSKDSVAAGASLLFDASNSTAYNSSILSYEWDFGNGEKSSGKTTSYTYNKYGQYTITLSIRTDSESECRDASFSKSIYVNESPTAVAGEDKSVAARQTFILDGSKSFDPDGKISLYEWDLGDGIIKYGSLVEHSYSLTGIHPISLKVKDNTGVTNNIGTDKLFVKVNEAPVARINSESITYKGSTISFDGSASNDPENDSLSFRWFVNNTLASSDGDIFSYEFPRSGSYNIRLEVNDNSGFENNISFANKIVRVYEIPAINIGRDTTICLDSSGEIFPVLSHTNISRPAIQWFVNDIYETFANSLKYYFYKPGFYQITAKLYDKNFSDEVLSADTILLRVAAKPKPVLLKDRTEFIGEANDHILFDAGFEFDNSGQNFVVSWDFGDKSKAVGNKVYHKYQQPGNYKVSVTVDDGNKTQCSKSISEFWIKVLRR